MTDKLTRRERERIIFQYLKGQPNPAYDVQETCHGKYVVKPKQIQIEEEEEEEPPKEPVKQEQPPRPSRNQMRREQRKRNRRAKADAYRILEQLNKLLSVNEQPTNESSDEEEALPVEQQYRATSLIEQPNLNPNPGPITFKRKRLRF